MLGPARTLWAVDSGVDAGLLEIDPDNGTLIREVKVAGSNGRGIAAGGDGRLWWVDFGGFIRATTTDAAPVTDSFDVGGNPQDIAAGPADQLAYGNPGDQPADRRADRHRRHVP